MQTLSRWKNLLAHTPHTIECSELRLVVQDFEGPIVSGPGRIVVDRGSGIRFFVYGSTDVEDTAFLRLLASHDNPYDTSQQFRLFATDYEGNEWVGGHTAPEHFADHVHGWPLTGELRGLSTRVAGPWVAEISSVELLFAPAPDLPLSEWMTTTTILGSEELIASRTPGRQAIEMLGTEVVFSRDPSDEALWLTASTNDALPHPCAERWLSEPLRILLGAAVYPRLTARNFGDGSAMVTLLPAPVRSVPSPFGLMQPFALNRDHNARFWRLYADILSMVAHSRAGGIPNIDGHEVTRLYEELWQAGRGSRWGILLALGSAVEALAKSLMSEGDKRSEFSKDALAAMEEYVRAWVGDADLRARMLSNLVEVKKRSVLAFLRTLAKDAKVDSAQVETWRKLRNSVMHGELVEPWSTEEGDRHTRELIILVHELTKTRIARDAAASEAA